MADVHYGGAVTGNYGLLGHIFKGRILGQPCVLPGRAMNRLLYIEGWRFDPVGKAVSEELLSCGVTVL